MCSHRCSQETQPPGYELGLLIVWTKTGEEGIWWSGLDVLFFDDKRRITTKCVYGKERAPIMLRTQVPA